MKSLKVPKLRFTRPVIEVLVTHVEGIGTLYVQPTFEKQEHSFRGLMAKMRDLKLDNPTSDVKFENTIIYAGITQRDDFFYRCVVTKEVSESQVSVFFIDIGNSAIIDKTKLYNLPIELSSHKSSLKKFAMMGIQTLAPKEIKADIDRKMFKWLRLKLSYETCQLVQIYTGETHVLLYGVDVLEEYNLERFKNLSALVPVLDECSKPVIIQKVSAMHSRLVKKRIKAEKLWKQSNKIVQIAERIHHLNTTTKFLDIKSKSDMFAEVFRMIEMFENIVEGSRQNYCLEEPRRVLIRSLKTRISAETDNLVKDGIYQKMDELGNLLMTWTEIRSNVTVYSIQEDIMRTVRQEQGFFQLVIEGAQDSLAEWQIGCMTQATTSRKKMIDFCASQGFETLRQDILSHFDGLSATELFKDLCFQQTRIEPVSYKDLKKESRIEELELGELCCQGECFKVINGLTVLMDEAVPKLKADFEEMSRNIRKMIEILVSTLFKGVDINEQNVWAYDQGTN